MVNFDIAFEATLQHEGGYAFVKGDNGGETYKGISRKFHPNWDGWVIVDNHKSSCYLKDPKDKIPHNYIIQDTKMDRAVRTFYRDAFWVPLQCHRLTSALLAAELFDTGVNMGQRTAVMILQQAVNLCCAHYISQSLKEDGVIGPITLRVVNATYILHPKTMLKIMNGLQFMRYISIVKYDESQAKFFRGWMKRV